MDEDHGGGIRARVMATSTYVALLRGINVGGKNMLPMRELVRMFEVSGCAEVRTYIQSGNVVFSATPACAKRLADDVAGAIEKRFGFRPRIVLRTAQDMADVAANNPFLGEGADVRLLHVVFLVEKPDARRIAALDPARSPGDSFQVRGREVYLLLANGAGQTKLSNAYLESTLVTTSTMRNWRTVLKLSEMAQQLR
jgi:uncharacterized protein (DUF1697 family)